MNNKRSKGSSGESKYSLIIVYAYIIKSHIIYLNLGLPARANHLHISVLPHAQCLLFTTG